MINRFLRFFMPNEPPDVICLFPRTSHQTDASYWSSTILSRYLHIASSSSLTRLEHCKAKIPPKHEFLIAHFTVDFDGKTYKTYVIIDRLPSKSIEELPPTPKNSSLTSLLSSPIATTSPSPSPSPSPSEHLKATLNIRGKVPATDRVMIPRLGLLSELEGLLGEAFGQFDTLSTLTIGKNGSPMSAPQLATLLDVVHEIARDYKLRKYQCYWFALVIFLVVKTQTAGEESSGDNITELGKLYFLSPGHNATSDQALVDEQYKEAWVKFQTREAERLRDPDQARQLAEERADKSDQERGQAMEAMRKADEAMRKAVEAMRKADEKRLEAEQSVDEERRKRLEADEAAKEAIRKADQNTKEERRKRLEADEVAKEAIRKAVQNTEEERRKRLETEAENTKLKELLQMRI